MNILIVTDLCPAVENEAGLPLTILEFAKGFLASGHEVKVFRPNFMFNTLLRGRKLLKGGSYSFEGVRIFNKNFFFPFLKSSVERAYEKFFKDENFDIILAHMPSGLLAAEIISKKTGVPFLAAVHASDITVLTDFKYAFLRRRIKRVYENSSCILARSFWLKDKIRTVLKDVKKPVEIIYSGVPLELIEKGEALERKFKPKSAKIFTASSFIKRKNLINLIKAYRKLKKKNPKISLEIAGDGPLREKIEKFIEKKKLDVKLLGRLKKEEVLEKMAASDIFALVSENETFGMVYMEAISQGMAVVCKENSGVAGIIEDGVNGFLSKKSARAIEKKILGILNLKEKEFLKISANAIMTAKMFSYENSIKNYLNKIEVFKL